MFRKPVDAYFPVIRPYTPIHDFNDPNHVEILVKKYPEGAQSSYLQSLNTGDSINVRGTVHPCKWKSHEVENLNLIASGAGITPMYPLLRYILTDPAERTKIKLTFAVNSETDILLKDELRIWEQTYPQRFKVVWTTSQPTEENLVVYKGYLNKEILRKELVGSPKEGKVVSKVFVCV